MHAFLMFAVLTVAVPDRPDQSPKQAIPLQEQLLGDWLLTKHSIGGKDIPDLNGLTMVFSRENLQHVYLREGMKTPSGTFPYTLNTTKNPAVISFRSTMYEGIVKVEGDLLTICFARVGDTQAPAEFISRAETSTTLLQATRIRK